MDETSLKWVVEFTSNHFPPHFIDKTILGYCVDSRLIKNGELFFALPGAKVDGHTYLEEVAKKGALAAVVSKSYSGSNFGLLLIPVDDVLKTFQGIATTVLAKRNPQIVAVTGSVGKTTTKDFIGTLLKQKYRVAVTPGNSNSQIGIPLAILNHTKGDEEILVIEMGMTDRGHISKLVQIAPPDVAVITTTALVHPLKFDNGNETQTIGAIGLAKAEIFSHPKTVLGILQRDIVNFDQLCKIGNSQKISFSINNPEADFYLRSAGEKIEIVSSNGKVSIDAFNLPGEHNRQNFLAAVAVARHFDLSWEQISEGMRHLKLPERRLQYVEKHGVLFVNDAYNACSVSLNAALKSLPKPKEGGRTFAVIGYIVELGSFSKKCHLEVGETALKYVDKVFCLGKECEPIWELWQNNQRPVEWTLDRKELTESLRKQIREGDVVLLKGSRPNNLDKVLEEI